MIGKEGALSLLRAGTAASRGDRTVMTLLARDAALTRLENNEIGENIVGSRTLVMARVEAGGWLGWASTSDATVAGVRILAERAYQSAIQGRLAPATAPATAPDAPPNAPPDATPVARQVHDPFSPATARLAVEGARERADDLATVAVRARRKGLAAAGGYSVSALEMAVATVSLRGGAGQSSDDYHRATRVAVWSRVSDPGSVAGSPASAYSQDARDIDITVLAEQAIARCQATRGQAGRLAGGRYDVVLEPAATRRLFLSLRRLPPTARRQVTASGAVTLVDDPSDPWGAAQAFDFEGAAKGPLTLIAGGTPRHTISDQAWHMTLLPGGATGTGAARGTDGIGTPHGAGDLLFSAGTAELVAKVERGLLVTRLGPVQLLDGQTGLVATAILGSAFFIEGGRAVRPVAGLLWRQSLYDVLQDVREVGGVPHLFLGAVENPAGDPVDDPRRNLLAAANYAGGRFPAVLIGGADFTDR